MQIVPGAGTAAGRVFWGRTLCDAHAVPALQRGSGPLGVPGLIHRCGEPDHLRPSSSEDNADLPHRCLGVAVRRYRRMPLSRAARERCDFVEATSDLAHVPELTVYEPAEPWQTLPILDQDGRPIQVWTGPDAIGFLARDDEEDS